MIFFVLIAIPKSHPLVGISNKLLCIAWQDGWIITKAIPVD